MRCSEAGGHLARSAASGRSPKAGGRGLQLLSEGVGRESKFSTVIIGMAMPSLSTWALEATEVYCWFPHPKEYTHTRMHAEHSCLSNADRTAQTIPSFLVGQAPPADRRDK